jgi:CBS domain containing-hemolysin-like protein
MTDALLLALSLGLVLACGVFVAAEFAFVTVDRGTVERAAASGDRAAEGVRSALESLSTQLSGAQVGITVTNLAIGFLAEPVVAKLVTGPLEAAAVPASALRPVTIAIAIAVATAFTMVFGELVPKNLAIAKPLGTAKATQGLQRGFTAAMGYPIKLLNGSANAIVRRLGMEPQEELRSARTTQELASLIRRSAMQGTLDTETADLMERSVTFARRTAGEIMTHRVHMDSVDAQAPVTSVVELARASGHSRFPVVSRESDNVVGAVHVKNAVAVPVEKRATARIRSIMVEATVVPETLRLDPLLSLLRSEGLQMAVVADEYGGTAGVVTLEDVVEEIVGDIADEHDPGGSQARRRTDGAWSVSGLLRPDEVASATGIGLPEHEDYDTIAGLFLQTLGRMPEVGEHVVVPLPAQLDENGDQLADQEVVITVERLDGLRIDRLALAARPTAGRSQRRGVDE